MQQTRDTIIASAVPILAQCGYAGTSMRMVAEAAHIQASAIYHYFPTKNDLFREVRLSINQFLDAVFDNAPAVSSARQLLRQRLRLHFDYIEQIVALLQYFMASRQQFAKAPEGGYVPRRAYRHMLEVITRGETEGVYTSKNPVADGKTLTHMVNGFLLEFYGHELGEDEIDGMVERLANFIERALEPKP